jgi:hypothetical protein
MLLNFYFSKKNKSFDFLFNYLLKKKYSLHADEQLQEQFLVSPPAPVYYKVLFPFDVNNIFIKVESEDNFCAVVSVQSFDCPVYDVGEIGGGQGHYQTMSKRASFNVYV